MPPSQMSLASNLPSPNPSKFVMLNEELSALIGSVKKMQLITTMDEILDGLKLYILKKRLFDPHNPIRICCKDDELQAVFGVPEFTIPDVTKLVRKLVYPVNSNQDTPGVISTCASSASTSKRKGEDIDEVEKKDKKCRLCNTSSSSETLCASPMILHIPSPLKYETASDTPESLQGYETAYVKDTSDTSDDLLSLNSDFFCTSGSIVAIEETFDLEYEVETDSDLEDDDYSGSDTDSDIEDTVITFICKTDSDMEFWADDSAEEYDYDAEITELDQWKCTRCGSYNNPPMRYCLRCWDERLGWLPEGNNRRVPPKRKLKSRTSTSSGSGGSSGNKPLGKEEEDVEKNHSDRACSSEDTPQYSSQDTAGFPGVSLNNCEQDSKLCMLCCTKSASASIIHGKYAHQFSCYPCAKKLQKKKKPCPICRRTIEKVVHQICVT